MKEYNSLKSNIKIYNDLNEDFKVVIKTDRLYIRSYNGSKTDDELIFQLFKHGESTKMYGKGGPFDDDFINGKITRWSKKLIEKDLLLGLLVFEKLDRNGIDDASEIGKFVGYCILSQGRDEIKGETEFAILLLSEHWGNGYGLEITKCLINDYSAALKKEGIKVMGEIINSIFATARVDNEGSNKILNKVGMKKFDQKVMYSYDRNLYSKTID